MGRHVYVIDDDHAVRASLQNLLAVEPDYAVRSFESGDRFLSEIDGCEGGVMLLDVDMPGASGLDVLRIVRTLAPSKFAVIILTGQGSIDTAVDAMKTGAFDFIEKPYAADALLACVGEAFLRLESSLAAVAKAENARARVNALSPRERDVLKWLIEGHANKHIAFELSISMRTVEIYRANLMAKLQVRSLAEAIRTAFVAGVFASH